MDATALWMPRVRHAELRPDTAPDPAPHEIRVKAIASGISTGTELVLYHGLGPGDQAMTPSTCEGRWDLPVKYGYQSVGRVIDAGRGSGYGEGDLVFCRYPHQDVYTIDATDPELVYRIPEFDPPEIGVLGNNADVALTALLDVPVRLGDVVVVAGLGIVGMFCALLARRTAGTLVVVDPFEYRRDIALRLGADVAVHPDDAIAAVMEASDGRGADVSIEASGAAAGLQLAIDVCGLEADVCVVGLVRLQADPARARAAVLLAAPQARELERPVRGLRAAAALGPGAQAADGPRPAPEHAPGEDDQPPHPVREGARGLRAARRAPRPDPGGDPHL